MPPMDKPRYVVKLVPTRLRHALRFRLFDTSSNKYVGDHYMTKRNAEKACDRRNADVLHKAVAYKEAKDNG